ncbi:hypothetical protein PFICI_04277 [Pestalotiopsis fici W106-1]|uniref:AB hydrolase-1 domain-containing protein n=1 Tax=Pestalotiopsis fici (strain W106-1 / CGMCC3.15140) TaxID=1229662 RepID=W3XB36_PESFW|nr:uncharacterized protein PFICI_04277 [Pestalotiopsis fici W106-1]ETS82401.1 hypothetical protein PFICI_04277 [Pestalotiopsis fici W106-1]
MAELKTAQTPTLLIKYHDHGPADGWPVILSHGFPYAPSAFDDVVPLLTRRGARVLVPYLRGFGPTRFRDAETPRSGQQAALGTDLLALMDVVLGSPDDNDEKEGGDDDNHNNKSNKKPIVAGFDWGGVASCVVAALWPERVAGLVSYAGYDIVDVAGQASPAKPFLESIMWYQHLFQTERGRQCLQDHRRDLCRLLWQQWSPGWHPSDDVFARAASAFDNLDFVDVVIHAYRFCFGLESGLPELAALEKKLAEKPKITVPCITLDGSQDPLKPGGSASHDEMFTGRHERRQFNVGHAFPAEAAKEFADAIYDVYMWSH